MKKKRPLFAKEEPFSKMAPLRHHFGSTFFLSVIEDEFKCFF